MDIIFMQYECDNAFPNPKCIPERFSLKNALLIAKKLNSYSYFGITERQKQGMLW